MRYSNGFSIAKFLLPGIMILLFACSNGGDWEKGAIEPPSQWDIATRTLPPEISPNPLLQHSSLSSETASISINNMWSFFDDQIRVAYSEYVMEDGSSTFEKVTPKLILMQRNHPEVTRIILPEQIDKIEFDGYVLEILDVSPYSVDVKLSLPAHSSNILSNDKEHPGGYCEEYTSIYAGELAHFFDDNLRLGISEMKDEEDKPGLQVWIAVKDNPNLTQTLVLDGPTQLDIGVFHIDILSVESLSIIVRTFKNNEHCQQE